MGEVGRPCSTFARLGFVLQLLLVLLSGLQGVHGHWLVTIHGLKSGQSRYK